MSQINNYLQISVIKSVLKNIVQVKPQVLLNILQINVFVNLATYH